ncbi:MAG TPA: energy-coupling factor transporter transmembrane component T [Longilinea sp.]|nr:energy-coupling factor transporter transmembrane component T [Longilinea sp.]
MIGATFVQKDTPIHSLDGRTKLLALMVIFTLVLVFTDPIYVLGLLALVMLAWGAAKIPLSSIKGILQFFGWIALIILLLNLFFYPGETNLFRISGPVAVIGFSGYITLEGILFGVAMVLRLLVIMIVAPLLVMTTPLPDLMLALVKIKVPYRFAFIMTTALSLLPAIQNRASIISQAQLCRGVSDFEGGKIWDKLRVMANMMIPLILGTFRDSQTLDVAMSSRAFGAPIKRTFFMESHFHSFDYVVIAFSCLLMVTGIVLRVLHLGVI